jgi:phage-related protein
VIELTEPQTWTTIGVLSAALIGMITVVTSVLMRTINSQISGVRNEMGSFRNEMVVGFDSLRSEVRSEIGGLRAEMNARFEVVDIRFESVNSRIDSLDRDVQALANKVFGSDRP